MKITQTNELREFNCMYREIEELYHEISLKSGLSDSAYLVLYAIVELGDGCLQIDIANRYFVSKQTISSSVKSLEKKGLLYLKHGKGRDMHLYLTKEGECFARQYILTVMEIENNVFSVMSEKECHEFLRLTRKYTDIMKESMKCILDKQD